MESRLHSNDWIDCIPSASHILLQEAQLFIAIWIIIIPLLDLYLSLSLSLLLEIFEEMYRTLLWLWIKLLEIFRKLTVDFTGK